MELFANATECDNFKITHLYERNARCVMCDQFGGSCTVCVTCMRCERKRNRDCERKLVLIDIFFLRYASFVSNLICFSHLINK